MPKLPPLNFIKCTSSDCDNDLHCFKATMKMKTHGQVGKCRSCGAELVNWDRVHQRDISDVGHTFSALRNEMIRHYYWHVEIDQRATNHARRKGRKGLRTATYHRIRKYVAPENYAYDGRQTPKRGNIIFYAQHATASCCRRCVEYWHGIPYGRDLDEVEIAYLSELCLLYIDERLPNLTDEGEKVPNLHRLRDQATG